MTGASTLVIAAGISRWGSALDGLARELLLDDRFARIVERDGACGGRLQRAPAGGGPCIRVGFLTVRVRALVGVPRGARLRGEPQLPFDEARITRQVADALAHAGAAGIFQSIGLAATAYDSLQDTVNSSRCNRAALECSFAVAGDAGKAIDSLERCYAMGFAHQDWIAHDIDLESLRRHPRFLRLLGQHAPAP